MWWDVTNFEWLVDFVQRCVGKDWSLTSAKLLEGAPRTLRIRPAASSYSNP